jgi:hypothetical protein
MLTSSSILRELFTGVGTMKHPQQLEEIGSKIRLMQTAAKDLLDRSENIPALNRNVTRIMASLKMLEINICDVLDMSNQS